MESNVIAEDGERIDLSRVRRAVVVVDVVESVRLMQLDESAFIVRWQRFVEAVRGEIVPSRNGTLVKHLGDGLLLAFDSTPDAIGAAVAMRDRMSALNRGCDPAVWIRLRTGINTCDVVVHELDLLGAGVNVAARLAAHAEPDQILLTADANDVLHPAVDVATEDLGELWLKHLVEPVRAFSVCLQTLPQELVEPARADRALRPVVAVLPFKIDGSDDGKVSIGELLVDDLICSLSLLPELQVVSRLSTSFAAKRHVDQDAASALKADYLVSGSCRTHDGRVLVHAQLFDVHRDEVLDHYRLADSVGSLFSDESPVISELVARIAARLLERQVELARRCALPNMSGYTLLLAGIALMHRLSRHDVMRSFEMLEHLCERWPRLAAPHAWKARWHLFSVLQGWSASPPMDRNAAFAASQRALELDPRSSVAHAVAGSLQIQLSQDVDAGLAHYDRALECNPSDPFAWTLRGTAHAFKGDGPTAVLASAQASRLSPLDPMHFLYDCHAASAALADDDPSRAKALAQRSLRANAQHLSTLRVLAIAQMLCGEEDDARATVSRLRVLSPGHTVGAFLRQSPSAAYPIGQRFAQLLAQAGLPQ